MANNASLQEYYTKLSRLYENAVNILTAINQSFSTSASEITVNVTDSDDAIQKVRIPSFLYLENKLEQLDLNMSNMFDIPESGEAWFSKASNMYKLKLVKSNTAPIQPDVLDNINVAGITDNNILKDMVSPKTYYRINISNIPDNIESVLMKKVVIHNVDIYNALINLGISTYQEYIDALYNLKKGIDYDDYESIIKMPIKKDVYKSRFEIKSVIDSYPDEVSNRLNYKLELSTVEYSNQEDSSITYTLKAGDRVCLGNSICIYKVKEVNTADSITNVIIEEEVGHTALQPISENSSMVLEIYNEDYSAYHYVDIPLEENEYIIVFIATIYNGIRSIYSNAVPISLNNVYIKDKGGNFILDSYGNKLTYIEYYNKYCKNIGDLILGLTETAYPQVSNYTTDILQKLQEDDQLPQMISNGIDTESNIQVVAINKHLSDDATSEDIINLHAQKNELNSKLQTIQANIDDTYTTLINTDFSQNVTVSQASLQADIQNYYTQRTETQSQLNSIIDTINVKASDLEGVTDNIKYRIRGVIDPTRFINYIQGLSDTKCDVIGIDVEYKYKSVSKDTNNVTTIGSNTFTDWNHLTTIPRERKLVFTSSGYGIEFVDYKLTDNIIKWNQIDIPITNGEDVVIRIRYKYNVGQPFINLYSPWSNEMTVVFPTEYVENVQINDIIKQNNTDTITSTFSKTLINDGYTEHIQNKVIDNSRTFFHNPENIYSGFNTAENNLISLKDKLTEIVNDLEKYKNIVDEQTNSKFDIYLNYDSNKILLSPNTINKINIYNTDHIKDMFIKKSMNIVIKNTGDTAINLYSIFPGDIEVPLLNSNMDFYNDRVINYERVPMFANNTLIMQRLGQWVYFRENNPYTKEDIYYNPIDQKSTDYVHIKSNERLEYLHTPTDYISKDNKQVLFGYRRRYSVEHSLQNIYNSADEHINFLKENSSYFNIYPSTQMTLASVFSSDPKENDIVEFNTSYTDAANTTYEYTVKGKYVSMADDSFMSYITYLSGRYNTGSTYQPLNNLTLSRAFTYSYMVEGDSSEKIGYNTVKSVRINDPESTSYKYSYIIGEGTDNWSDTSVKYLLQNDENINKDLTIIESTDMYVKELISKLDTTETNYSYNYFYADYDPTDESDEQILINRMENNYILRYEDIIGKLTVDSTTPVYLDETTSLSKFYDTYLINNFKKDANTAKDKTFIGAFLYPNLLSISQVLTEGNSNSSCMIPVGGSVSIPVVFEYYVDGDNVKKISKSLYFDIRNSLISNPMHYMIEVIGNYDYTTSSDIYTNIDDFNLEG